METQYTIELEIRTPGGIVPFARFFLGNSQKSAREIFNQLLGNKTANEKCPINLYLIETKDGLPINVDRITCTLNELAENCKTITKEFFKLNTFSLHSKMGFV